MIAPASEPTVSVLMRSKNSEAIIGPALASLFAQEDVAFDLLVVDSGSTDRTLEIVSRYPAEIVHIRAEDYFPGPVLNMAMARCRSDVVVFQNSDVVLDHPSALRSLVDAFGDPRVQAAFGRQVPRPDAATWVRRDYEVAFPEEGPAPPWLTLSLPFAAMRSSIWQTRPFYDAAWGSEDTEWGTWARLSGHIVRYVPEAVAVHSHNYPLRQLYGRRFIEGEADAFIYRSGDSLRAMGSRVARSAMGDAAYHLRERRLVEMAMVPVRRSVYHWAYFRGRMHGEARRRSGSSDVLTGQKAVLGRYA
jgi:rhamnosyltransferase